MESRKMMQMILLTKQTERETCMQTTNVWVPREKSGWEIQTGIPDSSVGKESSWNAGDPGLIPGSGRSTGEGKGCLLLYSSLENSRDCIVCGLTKSWTQLSDFPCTTHMYTAMYEIDNQKELTVQHREVYSVPCGDQIGKEIQKGEGTYIHIADSLCNTAETDTAM